MARPNRSSRAARMRRSAELGRDVLVGSAFGAIIVLARSWGAIAARIAALQDEKPTYDPLQN
jgi:hypothetical protein